LPPQLAASEFNAAREPLRKMEWYATILFLLCRFLVDKPKLLKFSQCEGKKKEKFSSSGNSSNSFFIWYKKHALTN
jgi:hypothetical protein|tara:strand:+ start:1918 stop:2145 length:228 start_codon:yes stop_codon:yes gene_type:complete